MTNQVQGASLRRMDELLRVWILEPIGYDEYGIEGVFATPEAAKAYLPSLEWDDEENGEWLTHGATAISGGFRIYSEEIKGST